MVALYDSEAWRNDAYPMAPLRQPLKSPAMGKKSFIYREGVVRIPLRSAPVRSGRTHVFTADVDIPASHVRIVYEFAAAGADDKSTTFGAGPRDGHGRLSLNGRQIGERDISSFGGFPPLKTFDVGRDLGSPVSDAYETPFAFTGHIDKITLGLK
jgi:hypothetical protein